MLQSSSPSKKASMTTGIQVFFLIVSILINMTINIVIGENKLLLFFNFHQ